MQVISREVGFVEGLIVLRQYGRVALPEHANHIRCETIVSVPRSDGKNGRAAAGARVQISRGDRVAPDVVYERVVEVDSGGGEGSGPDGGRYGLGVLVAQLQHREGFGKGGDRKEGGYQKVKKPGLWREGEVAHLLEFGEGELILAVATESDYQILPAVEGEWKPVLFEKREDSLTKKVVGVNGKDLGLVSRVAVAGRIITTLSAA